MAVPMKTTNGNRKLILDVDTGIDDALAAEIAGPGASVADAVAALDADPARKLADAQG